jgi:RNA polymerase sigma-70 factor (ECF subfamily)
MSGSQDSEETLSLLQRIEAGETAARDQLLARDRGLLRRIISLRMGPQLASRLDPSDVVQETHLEIARRLEDYLRRRPMPYLVWLRRTALEMISRLRRRHVDAARRSVQKEILLPHSSSLLLVRELLDPAVPPEQHLLREEQVEQIQTAVAELSEIEQEVLLMRTVEGLSNEEAAHVLDIAPAAASKRYGRAILHLREALKRTGVLDRS